MFFKIITEFFFKYLLEIMACCKHGSGPRNAAYNIEECEFFTVHLHDTRNYRSEGSYYRQKPGEDHSATSMFIIKFFCLVQITLFEKKAVFPLKHGRSYFFTKPITHRVSKHTCK